MKITKYLIIIFFLIYSYLFSYAYVLDQEESFYKSGFYGGINYSNLKEFSSANQYKPEAGFTFGFFTLFKINKYLFIQPEISFSQKSFGLDNLEKDLEYTTNSGGTSKASIKYNEKYSMSYFSIPLLLKLNLAPFFNDETNNKLFLLAGPVININTKASKESNYSYNKSDYPDLKEINFASEKKESIDVDNFQLSYFTGVSFEHENINFGLRYEKSMSNLSENFEKLVSYSFNLSIFLEIDKQKWQRIKNNITKNGIIYGVGFSSYYGDDAKNSTFIPTNSIGLYFTYKLSKLFYLQPEVLFTVKGAKDKDTKNEETQKIVQFPFLLKYYPYSKSVIKPNFLFGPSINVNLEKYTNEPSTNKEQRLSDYNFSLIGGAGIDFYNSSFDFRVNVGLNDVYNSNIKKKDISFMLTYQNIGTFDNFVYRFRDFGIKMSTGISDITDKKDINNEAFYQNSKSLPPKYNFSYSNSFGAFLSYELTNNLSFQPEIFYYIHRNVREYQSVSIEYGNDVELKSKDRIKASYLEIPLLLKYNYYKNYKGIINPYVFAGAATCQLSTTKYTDLDTSNQYFKYEAIEKKSHVKYIYGFGFDFDKYLFEVRYSTNFMEVGENSAELLFGARFSINPQEYAAKKQNSNSRTSFGLKSYYGTQFFEKEDSNKNLKATSYVFGAFMKNRFNEYFNFQYEMLFTLDNFSSDAQSYKVTNVSFPILAKVSYFNDINNITNPSLYLGSSYHFIISSNEEELNNKENFVSLIAGAELDIFKIFSLDFRFMSKANSLLKSNTLLFGLTYTF